MLAGVDEQEPVVPPVRDQHVPFEGPRGPGGFAGGVAAAAAAAGAQRHGDHGEGSYRREHGCAEQPAALTPTALARVVSPPREVIPRVWQAGKSPVPA